VTHVRLDIHPDGGLARLRLFGDLTPAGRARLGLDWFDRLPAGQALAVLAAECGLSGAATDRLVAQRPVGEPARLDPLLAPLGAAGAGARELILGSAITSAARAGRRPGRPASGGRGRSARRSG
jgi:allantoicase